MTTAGAPTTFGTIAFLHSYNRLSADKNKESVVRSRKNIKMKNLVGSLDSLNIYGHSGYDSPLRKDSFTNGQNNSRIMEFRENVRRLEVLNGCFNNFDVSLVNRERLACFVRPCNSNGENVRFVCVNLFLFQL
jgi:hypothetical protein